MFFLSFPLILIMIYELIDNLCTNLISHHFFLLPKNNYHSNAAAMSSRRLSLAESIEPMSSSYVSIVPQMPVTSMPYSLMPMYHFKDHSNLMELTPGDSLYKANPYSVMTNNLTAPSINSYRSNNLATMPTPLPSLAKELDDCLNKTSTPSSSIATHV